jgi:hypothetical protein
MFENRCIQENVSNMLCDQIGFSRRACRWMPRDHVSITTGVIWLEIEERAEECNSICRITEMSFRKGYFQTKHKTISSELKVNGEGKFCSLNAVYPLFTRERALLFSISRLFVHVCCPQISIIRIFPQEIIVETHTAKFLIRAHRIDVPHENILFNDWIQWWIKRKLAAATDMPSSLSRLVLSFPCDSSRAWLLVGHDKIEREMLQHEEYC